VSHKEESDFIPASSCSKIGFFGKHRFEKENDICSTQ